jgi:hypothetical protein
VPNERLPARGFSAEFFPHFHGIRQYREPAACHPAAAKKSGCGPMPFKPLIATSQFCPWFAATKSQAATPSRELAKIACKYLSSIEIRSKAGSLAAVLPLHDRQSAASA